MIPGAGHTGGSTPGGSTPGGPVVVVIPVYNHGRTVAGVVKSAMGLGFPVIVVDDGSTDDTLRQLRGLHGIRVLRHRRNRGKGAALQTGMAAAADARWALTLDADGQHDPNDAPVLLSAVGPEERAIVVGKRVRMDGAPWTSRFGREFSNFWVRVSGGPRISDTQSGFRLYPLPEAPGLPVFARRYQYEIEVLVKARWAGIPVKEAPVPVVYPPDGQRVSHFHPFFDFLRNFGLFARLITRRVFTPTLWRVSERKPRP